VKRTKLTIAVIFIVLALSTLLAWGSANRVLIFGDSLIFRDSNGNEYKMQATAPITPGTIGISNGFDMNDVPITDVEYIDMNLDDGVACSEGRLTWNDDDGTLNICLKGGTVNLQTGQEVVTRVKNDEGSDIDNGEVVYVSGASGANVEVKLPIASNALTAPLTFGLATEDITSNQLGYVTLIGNVRGLNTSGSLVSETWADGDVIYLSSTTAGAMTKVRPTQPDIGVVIGVVLRAHATEGVISVNPTVIQRHSLSSDVLITSIADNDITYWDAAATVWKNEGLANIGSGLTEGSVVFVNSGTEFEEDNSNFFWDDDNNRLGVGVSTPTQVLDVNGVSYFRDSKGPYAEMYFHSHDSPLTIALAADGSFANITGLTNGVFSDGMTLNSTNGSVTVTYGGVYSFDSTFSLQDPDGNSEEYNGTVGVNGTEQNKCDWHRDISVLSQEGVATSSCLLNLSANDVVTALINSAGGDDAAFEALNWTLTR
jgi:hypothetical protein